MAKKNLRKSNHQGKEQKEFEEEVLQIDRVTRVVKGGRRLRFRATVAIGDKKGRVGVGVGKSSEVVGGIQKAVARAKRNLITVPITKGDTIPHPVKVKYKAARMLIMPASKGTGVIAGGSLRKILGLAGVKNVLSKNIGTRNTLVTAQAAIKALMMLRPVKEGDAKKFEDKKPVREERDEEDTGRGRKEVKTAPVAADKPKAEEKGKEEVSKAPDKKDETKVELKDQVANEAVKEKAVKDDVKEEKTEEKKD